MKRNAFFRSMFLLLPMLFFPLPVRASSTINLSFAGSDSYVLSGANLEDAGAIEASFSYDPALYGNPRLVTRNAFGGATVKLDGDLAGNGRITVTAPNPMKGDGLFATLVFDPIGSSFGYVKSFSGRVYGANGSTMPSSLSVTNPTPPLDASDPDDQPLIKDRESKGQSFMGGEVAYVPPEVVVAQKREEEQRASETGGASATREENAAAPGVGSEAREKEAQSSAGGESILERFRLFTGERTPKNLLALFEPAPSCKQEPPVLLADGKGTVKVTISQVPAGKTPTFSFKGARYVSCKKLAEDEWLVEARPDKGAVSATITLAADGKTREIPLVVSPKASVDLLVAGSSAEADFLLFLNDRGTPSAPKYDLNGDAKRDYLDEYIFTANYLVEREKMQGKKGTQ